jgi:hypothetical protein
MSGYDVHGSPKKGNEMFKSELTFLSILDLGYRPAY